MSHPVAPSGRGIAFSLAASLLFTVLSGYTTLLRPLDGLAIFAWRMIWTLPGVLLIVHLTRKRQALAELLRRFVREPALWALVPLMAALNAVQLWVFLWAPLNGQTVAVSMGYFLTPLVMVLVGRVLYGERMYRLQCIAVALALLGVLHELWLTRAIAWPTLLVVLGYPPYFVLRRISKMEPVSGFALEMMLIFPVALGLLYQQGEAGWGVLAQPLFWPLLAGLGLISSVALLLNITASHLLPMGLWGLLGYVEPALLFLLAITFLGEPLSADRLLTYGPIWLAVLLTGAHTLRQQRKQSPGPAH